MAALDLLPIYNVTYRPDLNPIEEVFSVLKAKFRKYRLRFVYDEEIFDPT